MRRRVSRGLEGRLDEFEIVEDRREAAEPHGRFDQRKSIDSVAGIGNELDVENYEALRPIGTERQVIIALAEIDSHYGEELGAQRTSGSLDADAVRTVSRIGEKRLREGAV